jgi:prepilin-type N-terminal cleavage/methylation domain-containing protein
MRHRPGVTLVEVLVAIFIMAIGMLALLALFPLGAISMAQALKDDRCAQAAVNAEAFAVAQDMRHDVMVAGGGAYTDAFGNPFGTVGAISSTLALAPGYTGPSNGVIVDPFTYPLDATGANQQNVGRVAGTSLGVPRRSIAFSVNYGRNVPMTPPEAARWCSMLDGITFVRGDNAGPNAVPEGAPLGPVIRDNRYTWAWLLRRPRWSDDSVIDMSVIVYSGRPTVLPPSQAGETTCIAVGAAGGNSVVLTYAGTKPSLRSGGWILDVTPTKLVPGPPAVQVVYGYPYRVVNVSDTGANQLTLELQSPLRQAVGLVTVLEYAVEVFDRGSFVQP